jgi:ATP-dependent Clp protease ATP-binding subunit ClpA
VIAGWTGVPIGRLVRSEIDQVLGLADTLKRRIVGQDHALDAIARRIQTSSMAASRTSSRSTCPNSRRRTPSRR